MEELGLDPGLPRFSPELLPRHHLFSPQPPSPQSSVQEVSMSLWGKKIKETREDRKVWGEVIGPDWGGALQAGPGEGWTDGNPPLLPPPEFCKPQAFNTPLQPCLPPPRKQTACTRVNTIQVINCLQQLAPTPGPAVTQALKEEANYSFITIHTFT